MDTSGYLSVTKSIRLAKVGRTTKWKTVAANSSNISGISFIAWSTAMRSTISAAVNGTSSAGSTPSTSDSNNLDLTVLQRDPSVEANDHGWGPRERVKTRRRSMFLVWAAIRRRAKRFLSALSMTSFPRILTDESDRDAEVDNFSLGIGSKNETLAFTNLSLIKASIALFPLSYAINRSSSSFLVAIVPEGSWRISSVSEGTNGFVQLVEVAWTFCTSFRSPSLHNLSLSCTFQPLKLE